MNSQPYKILIVDESSTFRAATIDRLRRDAEPIFSFLEAGDETETVEICRCARPDCVLLAADLSGADVRHLLEQLNPDSHSPEFPVILLIDEKNCRTPADIAAQSRLRKNDLTTDVLRFAVQQAIETAALRRELQASQTAVKAGERRYQSLFDQAAVGIVRTNEATGHFEEVNDEFCRLTGYSRDELRARDFAALTHPDDCEKTGATLTGERPSSASALRLIRRDQTVIWTRITTKIERDAAGQITHRVSVIEDMTTSVLAETALRETEERRRVALEAGKMGTWEWFPETGIINFDEFTAEIFGFYQAELSVSDRDFFRIVHESDVPQLRRIFEQSLPHGESAVAEFRLNRHGGQTRWIYSTGRPVFDEAGEVRRVVGVHYDITQRKLAEAEIVGSRRETLTILESITDAFVSVDGDWRFTFVNAEAERLLRQPAAELLGAPMIEKFPGIAGTPFERCFTRAMETGETASFEEFFAPLGNWFEVRAYPSERGLSIYFRNVTERRRAQEQLRISEERLSLAMTGANIGTFDWNIKTGEINRSGDAENAGGAAADNYSFEKFVELVHPLDRDAFRGCIASALETGEYECEFRVLNGGGDGGAVRWLVGKGRVFFDDAGTPARLVGVDIDITKRKTAEGELLANQRFTQSIVETAPSILYTFDLKTKTNNYLTGQAAKVLGYSSDELKTGQANFIENMMHPDDIPAAKEHFGEISRSANEDIFEFEYRMRHKSGDWRWFRSRDRIFRRDENNRAAEILGVALDITERRRAEVALRESEERFRSLFDSIDEGFCIIEMIFDDDQRPMDYRFVQANPALERLTGLKNAVGGTARELIPDLEEFWFETYGAVALTGESARFENKSHALGKWFEVYASRIGDAGSRRVAVVFNDITSRKQIEHAREESLKREQHSRRQAEDANRAKDEFLAMLSHELRSPLNAMYGWTQILQNTRLDEQKTRQAVEVIARSVRLQNALIEDLLDISRIISGKMQLENEIVSLVSIVRSALDAAIPAAEKQRVRIVSRLDLDSDEIYGDRHRLTQIVNNLLNNAVKFTPAGGRVLIELRQKGAAAELVVTDSGIGIEPEILPFIFDRFKQADASSKRKFGGLGLGLAIVKHLVELHGGAIFADSEGAGSGATFSVRLPIAARVTKADFGAASAAGRDAGAKLPLAGLRILAVDDDADALDLMRFALESQGAIVGCQNSARAALLELQSAHFDLLISDLGMAEMDGFDLIRRLRAHENAVGAKLLPAIALTGYVSAEDRRRVFAAGFQAHLPKPVEFERLLSVVAEQLI